jgi:hypothetical protein
MVTRSDKIGVEELTKLVIYISKIGGASWEVLEDGKVGFTDIDDVWGILRHAQKITQLDFSKIALEWDDLTDDEKDYLVDTFRKEFAGPIADIENLVEKLVAIAAEVYQLIARLITIFKRR